jgi:lactoylglutathione lyase
MQFARYGKRAIRGERMVAAMNTLEHLASCGVILAILGASLSPQTQESKKEENMHNEVSSLGAFSVSLAVKDIKASKAFYEKLDFKETGGNLEQNWIILRNGKTTIGLFQGMFDANIMTFNPGWNAAAEPLDEFEDIRDLQRTMKERGLKLTTEADESTSGPASLVLVDPDGNMILVDQHVKRAEKD